MNLADFSGRIRILELGGKFCKLTEFEQRLINSLDGRDQAKARSKAKKQPRLPIRRRMRAYREFDYRTNPKGAKRC